MRWIKHYTELRDEVRDAVLESLQTSTIISVIERQTVIVTGRNRTKRLADIFSTEALKATENHVIVFNKVYAVIAETENDTKVFTPSLYIASLQDGVFLFLKHENVASLFEFLLRNAFIQIQDFREINNLLTSIFT